MNYYYQDYQKARSQSGKELLKVADEIISEYTSGNKKRSLEMTKTFLVDFEAYLTGNRVNPAHFVISYKNIETALSNKLHTDVDPMMIEIGTATTRIKTFLSGAAIDDLGIDHNARFVDWALRILGLSEKTVFNSQNQEYLVSQQRYFSKEKEKLFSGRKMMFYRNAYRAEMYSHKLFTEIDREGQYDMYTPLILSRMAVEQYLKFSYEKHFGEPAPATPSECREKLWKGKFLTSAFSNEIHAVLKRGNANTHEGYASYVFANMHCIQVLKKCFEQM